MGMSCSLKFIFLVKLCIMILHYIEIFVSLYFFFFIIYCHFVEIF